MISCGCRVEHDSLAHAEYGEKDCVPKVCWHVIFCPLHGAATELAYKLEGLAAAFDRHIAAVAAGHYDASELRGSFVAARETLDAIKKGTAE
jgi:hypothetical protein